MYNVGLQIEYQIYQKINWLQALISHVLRSKEEKTTDTEDIAIAADAIQGLRDSPHGTKIPATDTKNLVHFTPTEKKDTINSNWHIWSMKFNFDLDLPAAIGMPIKL